jgi:Protein of unknown function (DUF1403)
MIESSVPSFLPRWIALGREDSVDTVAFSSGAALAVLDVVLRDPNGVLPGALLRDRLALDAAAACLKFEGRRESTFEIRDAVCLARAGDAMGPAGDMFMMWRLLTRVNLKASNWRVRLTKVLPDQVSDLVQNLRPGNGSPVAQATQVLGDVLRQFPRRETLALMLAEVTLARAIGWDRVLPMLATHLTQRNLLAIKDESDDPALSVHRAISAACDWAVREAADLSRRASNLRVIAPKLRTKRSDDALELFLSHDAISPSGMLSPMIKGTAARMTGRSARRLCDRLVDLGVVRELTGRTTFRLYGL